MKRLLILFFAVTVAFLISSCATNLTNQKFLIGTWRPVNVEKFNLPKRPSPTTGTQGKINSGTGKTISTTNNVKQPESGKKESSMAELRSSLAFYSDKTSSLTFTAKKTAVKEFQGKAIPAKWKLRNQGTRLLIISKDPGTKTTYDIISINDTTAVMAESFSIYHIKITYKKVKK
jgi:hypothetical protein